MKALSDSQLCLFFFQVSILLFLARGLGEIFRRLRQPPVVGEIMAGILLGPSVFGRLSPQGFAVIFPADTMGNALLDGIKWLGVLLFVLTAGLEMDFSMILNQKKAVLLTSLIGLSLPFLGGFLLGIWLPGIQPPSEPVRSVFPFFLGTAVAVSALPVTAKILMDIGLLKSRMGLVTMGAATIADLFCWIAFSFILTLAHPTRLSDQPLSATILLTIIFSLTCLTAGKRIMALVTPWPQDKLPWPGGMITFAVGLSLLFGALATRIGVHAVYGALLAGITIGESATVHQQSRDAVRDFVASVFAPIFFGTICLRVDIFGATNLSLLAVLLIVGTVTKVLAGYFGAKWGGLTNREALGVGVAFNARGAMEIIMALIALQEGLIGQKVFAALVELAVITSLVSGPALSRILRQ